MNEGWLLRVLREGDINRVRAWLIGLRYEFERRRMTERITAETIGDFSMELEQVERLAKVRLGLALAYALLAVVLVVAGIGAAL